MSYKWHAVYMKAFSNANDLVLETSDISNEQTKTMIVRVQPMEITSFGSSFSSDTSSSNKIDQDSGEDRIENAITTNQQLIKNSFDRLLDQRSSYKDLRALPSVEKTTSDSPEVHVEAGEQAKAQLSELVMEHTKGQHHSVYERTISELDLEPCASLGITQAQDEPRMKSNVTTSSITAQAMGFAPNISPVRHASTVPLEAKEFPKTNILNRNRFSFQPGDDSILLSPSKDIHARDTGNIGKQDSDFSNLGIGTKSSPSNNGVINKSDSKSSNQPGTRPSMLPVRTSREDSLNITRADSVSSVVTAVRHNSAHSSVGSRTPNKAATPRPIAEINTCNNRNRSENNSIESDYGNAEAVFAASRAFNSGTNQTGLPAHLQPDLQEHRQSLKKQSKLQERSSNHKSEQTR